MKTKSFQTLLEKRLSKAEIAEIEEQAKLEVRFFQFMQDMITEAMDGYMKKNKVGFNELVRKLDWSPTKVAKIKRGEANLTLTSIAHLLALLGEEPSAVFRKKK